MSIWASFWGVYDDEHDPTCESMTAQDEDGHIWRIDRSKPCTCHAGPIVYTESNIDPSTMTEHSGSVDLAYVPSHVYGRPVPYLRVGINEATVVLTEEQIRDLLNALTEFVGNLGTED